MVNPHKHRRTPASEPSNLRQPQAAGLAAEVADRWPSIEEDAARAARALSDEALIAAALAAGRVTRCPPGRAINAGETRPVHSPLLARGVMSMHWRSGKGQS